ncbi:MAG: mechanosensitive ion channel [Rickettsiales bacterium]|nr:mechanosensitive ion channel [Rickettsiales bacterium]
MREDQINYDKIFSVVEKTFASSSFYLQSLSVISCFILAYFFYRFARKIIFPKLVVISIKKNIELNRILTGYLLPLLYPLFAILFLSVGLAIFEQFFKETILFSTTLRLITLFLFLRFLRISSNSNFVANAAGIFLMPALILDIFGVFDSTAFYLDQYAFKIGAVRISIYLVIKAFIVLLILFWLANLVLKKSRSLIENSKNIESNTKNIINKFIDILVYAIVIIAILKIFGVDMTTFAVLGGAIGVGIGFGLQKIASNFISGIILLFEKSVEIGDWIEIESANIFGVIKSFGGRHTLIECFDGKEIMIPNEDFITGKVTNWTYSNNRARIEINLGVAYESDLKKVKEIIVNCAAQNPRCLNYPEIECYITQFGEYDIKFTLYFWISDITKGRMSAKSEVMMAIWQSFKENNIRIPLPQREIKSL